MPLPRLTTPRMTVAAGVLVLVGLLGGVALAGGPFPDVPAGHPFEQEIAEFSQAGITGGFDDGTYRPSTPVSRQAMAAFMTRGLPRVGYATASGLFTVGTIQITLLTVTYHVPGEAGGTQRLVVNGTTSWEMNNDNKSDACADATTEACDFQVGIYDNGSFVEQTTGRITTGNDGGVISVQGVIPNVATGSTHTITLRAQPGLSGNLGSGDLQLRQRQLVVTNVPFFG